jgi:hypothetical protein
LRVLYWLCCLSVLIVLWQACYGLFINPQSFDSPGVQIAYWAVGVGVGVAVIAIWAELLRRRRLFGIACLAVAALHVCVGALFNLEMAGGGTSPLGGALQVLRAWDLTTWYYCWNWMAILLNAAACFYLLRNELARWLRGAAVEGRGFLVGEREP